MAERLAYHWKHGWIPLTHAAALSKAHGSSKLADKYVPGTSSHHAGRLTEGKSARQIHVGLEQHARLQARPGMYQGQAGHHLTGTDTKGRKVAAFVPGDRAAAQRAIDNVNAGRPAFTADQPSLSPTGAGGPANEREAFRMKGPELRQHAANGSTVAQAELDRRAGKKGAPTRKFNRPGATTKPEPAKPEPPKAPPPPNSPEQRKAASLARWEAENRRDVPAGYTVKSPRISSTEAGGQHMGLHTVYSSKNERIGSVLDRKNGRFLVLHNGKQVGNDYATRREAFAALTAKHEAIAAQEAKKADAAAKRQANATPVGIFEPNHVVSDGTRIGDAAAAKIKQSFKYKNHTVHIETAMTKDQTRAFLGDVHSVLLKTGHMDGEGITFHVPSGDGKFRLTRRGGLTGGYVRRGQRTIFVNPKIANGELAQHFGGLGAGDSLMPAAGGVSGRQYVITHELGHIVDNQHQHTFQINHVVYPSGRAPDSFSTTHGLNTVPGSLHRGQRDHLSKYGRSNAAEGYAEAYAQWVHGGPGSNPAADAYAAQFGWAPPKWYREGQKKP